MRIFFTILLSVVLAAPVFAKTLDVVTTSSTGALLVREVAGAHANIRSHRNITLRFIR